MVDIFMAAVVWSLVINMGIMILAMILFWLWLVSWLTDKLADQYKWYITMVDYFWNRNNYKEWKKLQKELTK